eukprot:1148650-Pelagomonas_calceolata.AAC.6
MKHDCDQRPEAHVMVPRHSSERRGTGISAPFGNRQNKQALDTHGQKIYMHSRDIAGGNVDPTDRDLAATALREAGEELAELSEEHSHWHCTLASIDLACACFGKRLVSKLAEEYRSSSASSQS